MDTPIKKNEDPVRLKPKIPGLRIKHFATEPCRTPRRNSLLNAYTLRQINPGETQFHEIVQIKKQPSLK